MEAVIPAAVADIRVAEVGLILAAEVGLILAAEAAHISVVAVADIPVAEVVPISQLTRRRASPVALRISPATSVAADRGFPDVAVDRSTQQRMDPRQRMDMDPLQHTDRPLTRLSVT